VKTNTWPRALKDLFALRNHAPSGRGILQPKPYFNVPKDHPLVPRVAPIRAIYTLETAEQVVDLMRDVYRTCRDCARPEFPALEGTIEGFQGSIDRITGRT
jgi:hypothetical protein